MGVLDIDAIHSGCMARMRVAVVASRCAVLTRYMGLLNAVEACAWLVVVWNPVNASRTSP